MKNKAKRNVFILSLCVVASIPFAGGSASFDVPSVDKKEASINSVSIAEVLSDDETNVLESSLDKCDDLISFVESNFSTFVREYNVSTESTTDKLEASYVEYTSYTYIIEDEIFGVYFDFDEDNGYTLISEDYTIYELETCGDLVELKEHDTLFYSRIDGFEYLDENGSLQHAINEDLDAYCYSEDKIYPGQEKVGDGEIESASIGDYVKERYPDYTYESKNENLANDFDCARMYSTSYYIRIICDENGNPTEGTTSEGNCALNAIFNLIRNWTKCSLIKGVDYTSTTDVSKTIESDPLYEEYGIKIIRSRKVEAEEEEKTETYSSKSKVIQYYYWEPNNTSTLNKMPNLYTNIRAYAIDKYNYTPESGIKVGKISNIIEKVLSNYYGVKVSISSKSNVSKAIEAIDEGHAAYMSIIGSSSYSDHGVVLMGYQKYTYEGGWWIFSSTKDVYFYQIVDGWHTRPMYFDPNTSANPSLQFFILD